jgi:hypothetical protein
LLHLWNCVVYLEFIHVLQWIKILQRVDFSFKLISADFSLRGNVKIYL